MNIHKGHLRYIKDLPLAAFLQEQGFELSDFYREDDIVFFGFEPHPQLDEKISEFRRGVATGNIQRFLQNMNMLKRIIFDDK